MVPERHASQPLPEAIAGSHCLGIAFGNSWTRRVLQRTLM